MNKNFIAVSLAMFLSVPAFAQDKDKDRSPAEIAKIVQVVAPSLVRVEYTLQYDKSESPYGGGWRTRCPGCGRYHVNAAESVIAEERPVEMGGYLIGTTTVLTVDPMTNARFIKDISVRFGKHSANATPLAYALNGSALFLELDKPLDGAVPLTFDAARKSPYSAVTYQQINGTWEAGVESLSNTVTADADGRMFTAGPTCALIVDGEGKPVGATVNEELPIDGSWKGSPNDWPRIEQAQLLKQLQDCETSVGSSLPRVHLVFRSPKSDESSMRYDPYGGSESSSMTEWHGPGVLADPTTILVLANLPPDLTARLERIEIKPVGKDEAVEAKFKATLKDYGALVATLDEPIIGAAVLSDDDIRTFRNAMLIGAEVQTQGENRVTYCTQARIPGFDIGWRRQVVPEVPQENQFLFTREGELIAIPMSRREKVTVEERWRESDASMIPASYIRETLADLDANSEPSNVPLTEEQENRIAWMGVELQSMDVELARASNVSDLTRDGSIGALVVWVYDDSPAGKAGVQVGDILLRLHVEGHPKPLDVEGAEEDMYGGMGFPWDRLDEVPEEYFDQIPAPWPAANNSLNTKLTKLGFDTPYTAELVRDGKVMNLPLVVVMSPQHYDSATKFKSDDLGVTVKDLTYEVQRYLQRKPDDPGVIVARIEPGSRASVAGLKPFEIVTHVNDQPIMTVAEFEKATEAGGELRLSVKRMTRGRVVKIDMEAAAVAPEGDDEGDKAMIEVDEVEADEPAEPVKTP